MGGGAGDVGVEGVMGLVGGRGVVEGEWWLGSEEGESLRAEGLDDREVRGE